MQPDFDPYYRWLGIPPEKQPPDHYCLLGVNLFEDDPDVIETAANRQMGHLRTYQTGKFAQFSQKLLNEVAAAKVCLLNPAKKRAYDEILHHRLEAEKALAPSAPSPPPTPTYYDRLMAEAHAKLSHADVRRLEIAAEQRTKIAVLIGAIVVTLLLVLPITAFLLWSARSGTQWTGEAVPTADPQKLGGLNAKSVLETPAGSGQKAAPVPIDPAQRPDLIEVPDSLIEKPRSAPPPTGRR